VRNPESPEGVERRARYAAERKEMLWEAHRGVNYGDVGEWTRTKGRLAELAPEATAAGSARLFPSVTAWASTGAEVKLPPAYDEAFPGRVGMVCVSGTTFAQPAVDGWRNAFRASYVHAGVPRDDSGGVDGGVDVAVAGAYAYDVCLANTMWAQTLLPRSSQLSWARALVERRAREAEGGERTREALLAALDSPENHLFLFGDQAEAFKDAAKTVNKVVAYVFVLDARGRVRWTATGAPSPDDAALLRKVVDAVLREQRSPGGPPSPRPLVAHNH